jgi:hypothetical protein
MRENLKNNGQNRKSRIPLIRTYQRLSEFIKPNTRVEIPKVTTLKATVMA